MSAPDMAAVGGMPTPQAGGFQIKKPTDGTIINSPESPNDCKMFVGGISRNTNTDSLRTYFSQFGEVRDVDIKIDVATQASRGFGFVLFTDSASITAVEQAGEHNLDGKRIDPKRAEKRNAKIFCGGLKSDFDDEVIKAQFAEFGEVELYERRTDRNTGRPQAFCFITFKDDQVATKLCKMHWVDIMGKKCEIKTAVENRDKKMMMGGMRGGYHMGGYGRGGYGRGGGYGGRGGYQGGGAWGAGPGPQSGPYGQYGNNNAGYGGGEGGYDASGYGQAAYGQSYGGEKDYSGYGQSYGGGPGGFGGQSGGMYGSDYSGRPAPGGPGASRGAGRGGGPMGRGRGGSRPMPY